MAVVLPSSSSFETYETQLARLRVDDLELFLDAERELTVEQTGDRVFHVKRPFWAQALSCPWCPAKWAPP
jgi:hypothetical protein